MCVLVVHCIPCDLSLLTCAALTPPSRFVCGLRSQLDLSEITYPRDPPEVSLPSHGTPPAGTQPRYRARRMSKESALSEASTATAASRGARSIATSTTTYATSTTLAAFSIPTSSVATSGSERRRGVRLTRPSEHWQHQIELNLQAGHTTLRRSGSLPVKVRRAGMA